MALTREQYLLTKLAEECGELAQISLKTQQFGKNEKYIKSDLDNEGRMNVEFNDVLGVIDCLVEEFGYKLEPNVLLKLAKREKINKYYGYSMHLKMVEEE